MFRRFLSGLMEKNMKLQKNNDYMLNVLIYEY